MTSDDTRIQWSVSVSDWETFTDQIETIEGRVNDRLIRRHLESAIEEYTDNDRFAEIEEIADRFVRAAGRRPVALTEEKDSPVPTSPPSRRRGETMEIARHIDPSRREAVDELAAETGENQGQLLSNALYAYGHGGRAARLEEKLQRIADPAEELLAALADEADDGIDAVTRRTISIANRLSDGGFNHTELINAIEAEGLRSDETIEKYEKRVLNYLGYALHPNPDVTHVYLPEEKVRQIAEKNGWPSPDAPAVDRLPYSNLRRDQKVTGIKAYLARRAGRNEGVVQSIDTIHDELFDGHGKRQHIKKLAEEAAESAAYELFTSSTSGRELLRIHPNEISEDIREVIHEPASEPSQSDPEAEESAPDSDSLEPKSGEVEQHASDRMDELMAGTVATDGGH